MPGSPDELVRNSSEYPSTAGHRALFPSSYSIRKGSGVRCEQEPSANPVQSSGWSSETFPEALPFVSASSGAPGETWKTLDGPSPTLPVDKENISCISTTAWYSKSRGKLLTAFLFLASAGFLFPLPELSPERKVLVASAFGNSSLRT